MAELLAMGVRLITVMKWCLGFLFHSHRLLFCLSMVSLPLPLYFHFSFSNELLLLLLLLVMLMLMLMLVVELLLLLLLLLHLLLSIPLLGIHPLKLSSAFTLSDSLRVRWLERLGHRQGAWVSKLWNLANRRFLRQRYSLRLSGIALSFWETEMWQLLMHGASARRNGLLCPLRHWMSRYSKRGLVRLREGSLGWSLSNWYPISRDMLLLSQWLRRCRLNLGLW